MEQNKFELTKENYFSREASRIYMGSTQYKSFLECEARQVAKNKGEWHDKDSKDFLFGKAVHAWNEGVLDRFLDDNKHIMTAKSGDLKAEYKNIYTVIEYIKNDRKMMNALSGKKEVIFTSEMFGVPWKIMIDCYNEEKLFFSDLKNMASLTKKFWIKGENGERGHWGGFIENYGYVTQMAIYQEIERRAKERDIGITPNIVAVDKSAYPDKKIIMFKDEDLENALKEVKKNIERVIKVWRGEVKPAGCGKCEYCRSKKESDIIVISIFILIKKK
jgi:hypothetical protein